MSVVKVKEHTAARADTSKVTTITTWFTPRPHKPYEWYHPHPQQQFELCANSSLSGSLRCSSLFATTGIKGY